MAQVIDIQPAALESEALPERAAPITDNEKSGELDRFLSELRRMSAEERIRASRYTMTCREYWVYAGRYPNEVPLVNGELERIALTLE